MSWQGIPLQTEWADPYLGSYIDVGEGIQDRATRCSAGDRFIVEKGFVELLQKLSATLSSHEYFGTHLQWCQ